MIHDLFCSKVITLSVTAERIAVLGIDLRDLMERYAKGQRYARAWVRDADVLSLVEDHT